MATATTNIRLDAAYDLRCAAIKVNNAEYDQAIRLADRKASDLPPSAIQALHATASDRLIRRKASIERAYRKACRVIRGS